MIVSGERSWLDRAMRLVVPLFFVTTIAVPTTMVNKLVFGVLMVLTLVRVVSRPADTFLPTLSPLVALCIFAYGFVLALLGNADLEFATQFALSVAVLLLIYPVMWYDIDLDYVAKATGLVLVLLTVLFVAAVAFSQSSGIAAAVLAFFTRYRLGFAVARQFVDDPSMTYALATTTYLLLPFALFVVSMVERRSVWSGIAALIIGAAMMVSGSRGLMLTSLMTAAFVLLHRARNVPRAVLVMLAVPPVVYVLAFLLSATEVFSVTELSNAIKIGHVSSFMDHLSLSGAVFGEGLASFYFSTGRGSQVAYTEVTLLDMLRYFGFILTPLLYAAILFPSVRLDRYRGARARSVAVVLAYLLLSLTNPVLFNSAGLLVVVWYWHKVLRPLALQPPGGASLPATT